MPLFDGAVTYPADVTSPGPSLERRGDLQLFPLLSKEGARGRSSQLEQHPACHILTKQIPARSQTT